jgi:hypothetical protein
MRISAVGDESLLAIVSGVASVPRHKAPPRHGAGAGWEQRR